MKRLFYCFCAVLAVMMSASPSWAKLDVVASFSILGDMVEQVAGEKGPVNTHQLQLEQAVKIRPRPVVSPTGVEKRRYRQ